MRACSTLLLSSLLAVHNFGASAGTVKSERHAGADFATARIFMRVLGEALGMEIRCSLSPPPTEPDVRRVIAYFAEPQVSELLDEVKKGMLSVDPTKVFDHLDPKVCGTAIEHMTDIQFAIRRQFP